MKFLFAEPGEDPETSRRLVIPARDGAVTLVIVRASDVPTYVEYGAANLRVAGKTSSWSTFATAPRDLAIARCRLMLAGSLSDADPPRGRLRIATKYAHRAPLFRRERRSGIRLYGSMQLAPRVGLADRIVDLVDSGDTPRANGLDSCLATKLRARRLRERGRVGGAQASQPVRVQWDPERSLTLAPLGHRANPIGLSADAVDHSVDEWIIAITDVTATAHNMAHLVDQGDLDGARRQLPQETTYPLPDSFKTIVAAT